jgi:heme oxygenase
MEPFNLILKKATAELHRSVEATSISRAILSPELSRVMYAEYLHKSFLVHHAAETRVFPLVTDVVRDVEGRVKTPFILSDLMHLDITHTPADAPLPDDDYRNSLAFNLGLLYVTEGSVLGGQYILKHVKKTLGEDAPGSFLNVYGERTGSTWKDFLEALNQYAGTAGETQKQEIIEGALYGFKWVEQLFSSPALA